jgi:ribonuclease HI
MRYDKHEKVLTGSDPDSTNNRMELTAALSALKALKRPCQVTLYTDSEYLQRGITEWLEAWRARGWRTANRKPVQNQDLWQAMSEEITRHDVDWRWVRGHAGDPLNERVDGLARSSIPRKRDTPSTDVIADTATAWQIYTRASCLGPSGAGGWAAVMVSGDKVRLLIGGNEETSANEMELQAAIQALTASAPAEPVQLHTVSKYLQQGMTRWVSSWQARGWRTKDGAPVSHQALWLALREVASGRLVEWHILPSDARPPESEKAAVLAAQAAQAVKELSEALTE